MKSNPNFNSVGHIFANFFTKKCIIFVPAILYYSLLVGSLLQGGLGDTNVVRQNGIQWTVLTLSWELPDFLGQLQRRRSISHPGKWSWGLTIQKFGVGQECHNNLRFSMIWLQPVIYLPFQLYFHCVGPFTISPTKPYVY